MTTEPRPAPSPTPQEVDLDTFTDEFVMRQQLQDALPGFARGDLHIDALSVSQVRRNTSRHRNPCRMTLCYAMQVRDRDSGRSGVQLLFAQVFQAGLSEPHFLQHARGTLVTPAFGQALAHLPALELVLWALPNDPGLPQLAVLLDRVRAEDCLPWPALQSGVGLSRANVRVIDVELLRHEPQRRATLRYTLGATGSEAAAPAMRTLYAKTFCDDSAQRLHERFDHFWQRAQVDPTAPLVAPPLGTCPRLRTLWQASADGEPLMKAVVPGAAPDTRSGIPPGTAAATARTRARDDALALMARTAGALARLHDSALTSTLASTPRTTAFWLGEVGRRARKIGRGDPDLAERAQGVADAIEACSAAQAARPLSLIHGDFHPDQVWVQHGRIVLFDFDEFTLGDPMEDLAEFVIKLSQADAAPTLGDALITQYARLAPHRFDRRSLNWHLTVQALLQASRAFVYQRPGWASTLRSRLHHAEALAAALNDGVEA